MTMLTFHNDPAIKEKYVTRLKAHAAADEIIQGTGWENGKGCAIGCTLEKYSHAAYETELGIPEWLARLEDRIFEGLPNAAAKVFAVDFLDSVPVGVDLGKVKWQFLAFLLQGNAEVIERLNISDGRKEEIRAANQGVLQVINAGIEFGIIDEDKLKKARDAADAAAAAYAYDAAYAADAAAAAYAYDAAYAAAYAADAAAYAYAYAAADVADAYAAYAAYAAADAAYDAAYAYAAADTYQRFATELLRLLRDAK